MKARREKSHHRSIVLFDLFHSFITYPHACSDFIVNVKWYGAKNVTFVIRFSQILFLHRFSVERVVKKTPLHRLAYLLYEKYSKGERGKMREH